MKKMLLILAVLFSVNTFAKEEIKLVVGESFAPLMWNDNGTPRGVAVELGKAILEKAGFAVKVETCPWTRCQVTAENEGAFIVGFSKNDERLKKFFYSEITMYDDVVIAVPKGKEFPFAKDDDLKGKKIGAQNGASFGERFEKLKTIFSLDGDDGDMLRLKKIAAGRIDGGIFSLGVAGVNYSAKLAGLKGEDFAVLSEVIAKDPNFIATGVKTPQAKEKLEKINKAIKELTADGTIEKITKMTF